MALRGNMLVPSPDWTFDNPRLVEFFTLAAKLAPADALMDDLIKLKAVACRELQELLKRGYRPSEWVAKNWLPPNKRYSDSWKWGAPWYLKELEPHLSSHELMELATEADALGIPLCEYAA